jgi:outer membrane protein OmpA-like peptidoglycan-associated protein
MNKNQKIAIGLTIGLFVVGISYFLIYKNFFKKKKDITALKQAIKDSYDNLLFEINKSIILPVSYPFLTELASALNDNLEYKIDIVGHTDNKGTNEANLTLSRNRAKAVKDYLISEKVSESRITSYGLGESSPIATNDTLEGRTKNRRVEFKLEKIIDNSVPQDLIINNQNLDGTISA